MSINKSKKQDIFIEVDDPDKFVQLYNNCIHAMIVTKHLRDSDKMVYFQLALLAESDGSVELYGSRRRLICSKVGIEEQALSNSFHRLTKAPLVSEFTSDSLFKGFFLKKIRNNNYQLNPLFIFKSTIEKRDQVVAQFNIKYTATHDAEI